GPGYRAMALRWRYPHLHSSRFVDRVGCRSTYSRIVTMKHTFNASSDIAYDDIVDADELGEMWIIGFSLTEPTETLALYRGVEGGPIHLEYSRRLFATTKKGRQTPPLEKNWLEGAIEKADLHKDKLVLRLTAEGEAVLKASELEITFQVAPKRFPSFRRAL